MFGGAFLKHTQYPWVFRGSLLRQHTRASINLVAGLVSKGPNTPYLAPKCQAVFVPGLSVLSFWNPEAHSRAKRPRPLPVIPRDKTQAPL